MLDDIYNDVKRSVAIHLKNSFIFEIRSLEVSVLDHRSVRKNVVKSDMTLNIYLNVLSSKLQLFN